MGLFCEKNCCFSFSLHQLICDCFFELNCHNVVGAKSRDYCFFCLCFAFCSLTAVVFFFAVFFSDLVFSLGYVFLLNFSMSLAFFC